MRRFFCAFIIFAFVTCGLVMGYGKIERPEGVLRVGIGAEPATLDPALATGMGEIRVLTALYEGLIISDGEGGILPGVAESWKVSPDGLTYTFHMRADSTWTNEAPVTAFDFEGSLKRALSPTLAAPNAAVADVVTGATAYRKGLGDWASVGIKAVNDRTLIMALEKPSPTFLAVVASSPLFLPVPVDAIASLGDPTSRATHWTDAGFPTNGPFILKIHRVNSKIEVWKNKKYWEPKAIKLAAIEFYPIDNRASEEMAFLTGMLDVTMALPLNKVSSYRAEKSPYLRIDGALQVEAVLVNTKRPPLDNVANRAALAAALHREALCEMVLRAGQLPAYNFVPPTTAGGFDAKVQIVEGSDKSFEGLWATLAKKPLVYRYNSSDARKLVAETLQSQWNAAAGGRTIVTLDNLEWKTYLTKRAAGDFDMARIGWSADIDDPSNFLELFVSDSPNNPTGWANAEYDRLVKARKFVDAEAILMRELPVIPLYFNPNVYLLHPRVSGWIASPMDVRPWRNISAEAD